MLAAVLAAGAGYALGGRLGVVSMLSVVVVCVLVGLRERYAGRVLAGRGERPPARTEDEPADPLAGYGSLRAIEGQLSGAATPNARYDPSTRRLLRRHFGAALADRGIDLDDEPAACAAIGADLWPYVCPARAPQATDRAPGRTVLLRLIDRWESL
ncbi:hypothetical protein Athai_18460 [Actinocatenispora thailandica]|uniref:Uncharacterized protein n=1 Tax=Actinocatenispora thailandica TaxID=227318 RepID=A0A7R7HWQ8_9ACTN|nr:hypothetical protein Athai_18460 [Actinocatenispora thailandica]